MSSSDEEGDIKPTAEASSSRGRPHKSQQNASISDDEDEPSPKGKKRARVQGPVDDSEEEEEEQKEEDEEEVAGERLEPIRGALIRDESRYVVGSIVRIALENFLTYDSVSFTPGPDLNMILGPNGTGKSTIACAIAIGLGFSLKVLGRATKISAYVKLGTKAGWTELELKGHPGKKNLIIRRLLTSSSDSTSFLINGEASTAKEVAQKMLELNVSVGNLCTFLPQDRVASFSKLSSSELLVETQMAAGHPRLSEWHQTLIVERVEQKKHETEVDAVESQLKVQEARQATNEKDLAAFKLREKTEGEIAVLELLIPFAQYNIVWVTWSGVKEQRTELRNEILELEAANKPFQDSHAALTAVVKEYGNRVSKIRDDRTKLVKSIDKKQRELESSEDDVGKIREELDTLKKTESLRRKNIETLSRSVEKLEAIVANKPDTADLSDIAHMLKKIFTQRTELTNQINEIQLVGSDSVTQMKSLQNNKASYQRQLSQLSDAKAIREQSCAQWERATWQAVLWARKNVDRFKGKVHEPLRLSLTVRNMSLVDLAEAPISLNAFKTFVFEEREDYDFMMREVADKLKLAINGAVLRPGATLADYPRAFTPEKLEELGFDCVAIDLVDGPEMVLAYLCDSVKLHTIPIATSRRELNVQEIERMTIAKYFTPTGSNTVKRSAYGSRGVQAEVRALTRAKVMNVGGQDNSAKIQELQSKIAAIDILLQKANVKYKELCAQEGALQEEVAAFEQEKIHLGKQKEELQKPMKKWNDAKVQLDAKRTNLAREKAKPSAEQSRITCRARMVKYTTKRMFLALEFKALTIKSTTALDAHIAAQFAQLQADSDLRAMSQSVSEMARELADKRAALEEVAKRLSALWAEANDLLAVAKSGMDAAEGVTKAAVDEAQKGQLDLDLLEKQKAEKLAALATSSQISPEIMKQYEKRKTEIAALKVKLEVVTNKSTKCSATIKKVQILWLPKLEALIGEISTKFSTQFSRMNLLGEVRIAKHEDYSKWGIEILVSFRESEELHVLTAHRQSGGERALTTVMYLIALAELARAPFTLVDEINQGMDPTAERRVHNALVQTTCTDEVGQYFLITPKLLPNLTYHKRMKVLIINNGDWLPTQLSLKDLVKERNKRNLASMKGR